MLLRILRKQSPQFARSYNKHFQSVSGKIFNQRFLSRDNNLFCVECSPTKHNPATRIFIDGKESSEKDFPAKSFLLASWLATSGGTAKKVQIPDNARVVYHDESYFPEYYTSGFERVETISTESGQDVIDNGRESHRNAPKSYY